MHRRGDMPPRQNQVFDHKVPSSLAKMHVSTKKALFRKRNAFFDRENTVLGNEKCDFFFAKKAF
jgi:hypothetical protein